jgi:hypothetical protein
MPIVPALGGQGRARSFFKGRAEDGHDWRMLCAALEQQSDGAGLEAGARHAFACFSDMLAAGRADSRFRSVHGGNP